jgi:DNA helicase II / ATP-dependent DNA helicase PcrA
MGKLADAIDELRGNDRQWEAFECPRHTVVLAPPGSGKTKLLTTRLAYDLATAVIPAPQGAACITMTNEAAGELRRRLTDLGVRWRANLFVGTVHAFALSAIVMPFARACGRHVLAGAELASPDMQDLAFDRAFDAVLGAGANDPYARSTVDRVRRLGDYSGDPLLGGTTIAELSRRYEHELESLGAYDFNDIMRNAVEMLGGHEWLRRVLISAFPHLYVDEYQDLPPSLHALVELLCFDQAVDATLFAVGDPDQAIYGFLGTRPELLRKLAERSGVRSVELEINYRCANDIIEASLQALGEPRKVRGLTEGGDIIIEAPADGPEAQRTRAVELVQAAAAEDVALGQILVLTQGTDERDDIADHLRAAGVPVYARSDRDYRATPLTMAIEALALYAATGPRPFAGLSAVLDDWEAALPDRLEHPQLTALVALLHQSTPALPARDFVNSLGLLGLNQVSERRRRSDDARELQRLRAALEPGGMLADATIRDLGDRARAAGRVMAATLHGAKGLEFDVVIVCDVEEGRIPHWGSINSSNPAELEEDRRKFYVALTRARRRVHLVWAQWRISRKGNPYPIALSRFALDLIEDQLPGS